jgi:hypothetical protein
MNLIPSLICKCSLSRMCLLRSWYPNSLGQGVEVVENRRTMTQQQITHIASRPDGHIPRADEPHKSDPARTSVALAPSGHASSLACRVRGPANRRDEPPGRGGLAGGGALGPTARRPDLTFLQFFHLSHAWAPPGASPSPPRRPPSWPACIYPKPRQTAAASILASSNGKQAGCKNPQRAARRPQHSQLDLVATPAGSSDPWRPRRVRPRQPEAAAAA